MALSQQDALSMATEFSDRGYLVAISLMTTLANAERTQEPMIPAFQEKMMERGILFVERFFAGYEHGRSLDAVAAFLHARVKDDWAETIWRMVDSVELTHWLTGAILRRWPEESTRCPRACGGMLVAYSDRHRKIGVEIEAMRSLIAWQAQAFNSIKDTIKEEYETYTALDTRPVLRATTDKHRSVLGL